LAYDPVKKQATPANVYQLKITLKGIRPPIWRRIHVPGDVTLYRLHQVLQVVMGWQDYHLHWFIIRGTHYGVPDPEFDEPMVISERRVRLGQLIVREKEKFVYEYDFGDDWRHEIVVERILPAELENPGPTCLAGKRRAPPEDCGGIGGYEHLLEVLANPDDEEHDEMLVWAGEDFDPEHFDLAHVNQALKKLRL
jgi:hypothetical protein